MLFGLPRNLADVPFPDGTRRWPSEFPDGFDCTGCYLNGVYTYGPDHPELFPGEHDPGLAATRQAVEAITGLPVNYYAMVNLKGFRELVDAVGGVTMHVSGTPSPSAASGATSPAPSSRARGTSTATRRSGTPAAARTTTTTPGWRGRSAS